MKSESERAKNCVREVGLFVEKYIKKKKKTEAVGKKGRMKERSLGPRVVFSRFLFLPDETWMRSIPPTGPYLSHSFTLPFPPILNPQCLRIFSPAHDKMDILSVATRFYRVTIRTNVIEGFVLVSRKVPFFHLLFFSTIYYRV